ncbi:MAG: hypothetical protein VB031_01130 [Eubacteriaceae bacterium]|nr:hypothetical protein [Eubacteriaceae bacterium]
MFDQKNKYLHFFAKTGFTDEVKKIAQNDPKVEVTSFDDMINGYNSHL